MTSRLEKHESRTATRLATLIAVGAICAVSASVAVAGVTAPAAIAAKGAVTYCMDVSFPPLEFYDPKTNEPAGFDIDFATALAKEMGVKAEIKNITFDGLIPAVQAGQCDAIVSGLYDKPKRREVLDFVDYALMGNSVIVRANSTLKVDTLQGLSGMTAAVETGTQLEQDLVGANDELTKAGKPPMKISAFPKASTAFEQLITGMVDTYYSSTIQEAYYNQQNPGQLKLASPQMNALYIGIATPKSAPDLHAAMDAAYKSLLANGGYDQLIKKWGLESIAFHP